MSTHIVTEAGFYGGKFLKSGASYEAGEIGGDEVKPASPPKKSGGQQAETPAPDDDQS
ncbi:MAG: hypothetical protein J0H18_17585 [Rhizobiales bacterium]|nr:hypothetical protein [Hyphomicrobiales bacterium]